MRIPVERPAALGRWRRLVALDALLLVAVAGVFVAAARTGSSGRRTASAARVVPCASPEDALVAWRRAGVHGRVLVHFAREIAMSSEPGAPSPRDYVLRALREGIVRRVVHVIPDAAWPEVAAALQARPDVERVGEGFLLEMTGAPILVLRRSDLPDLPEPPLVTIEGDRWSPDALGAIAALLRGRLRSDLVAWWATIPDRVRLLETLAAP